MSVKRLDCDSLGPSLISALPCPGLFCSLRVVALSMSPVDDTFISGSLDKTIRLWDLRSPNCQVSQAQALYRIMDLFIR